LRPPPTIRAAVERAVTPVRVESEMLP